MSCLQACTAFIASTIVTLCCSCLQVPKRNYRWQPV